MRLKFLASGVVLSMAASLAFAQTQPAQKTTSKAAAASTAVSQAAKYDTTTTKMRTLLDDPAAKAVLAKYIPDLINQPDHLQNAMDLSLKELQQAVQPWSPNFLPDAQLAQLGQDLAQLPVKK